jgi:hypothetical protein
MKKKERNTLFREKFLFRSCFGFSSDSLLGGKERGVAGLKATALSGRIKASALAAGAPSASHLRAATPPDPVTPGRRDCIERPEDLLLFTTHDGNPQGLSTLGNTRGKWSMSKTPATSMSSAVKSVTGANTLRRIIALSKPLVFFLSNTAVNRGNLQERKRERKRKQRDWIRQREREGESVYFVAWRRGFNASKSEL